MKRFIIVAVSGLGILLLLLVIAVGGALAWLQTDSGQKFLENTLNQVLVWEDGRVEIEGISGGIPFNFGIKSIRIHDRDGVWLQAENSRLHWSWRKLLDHEIFVKALGVQVLQMDRVPHTEPSEETEIPDELKKQFEWHWPLPALRVENLYVHEARLGPEVLGEEAHFSLQGSLLAYKDGFVVDKLDVLRLDKAQTSLKLALEFQQSSEQLEVDLHAFDSATLPAMLPRDLQPDDLDLSLTGKGPVRDWKGRLHLRGGELLDLAMDIDLKLLEDRLDLAAGAEIQLSPAMAPEPVDHYLQHVLKLKAHLDLIYEDNLARLQKLQLDSDIFSLAAEADFALDELHIQGLARLEVQDINPLLQEAQLACHEKAELNVGFSGPVNSPAAEVGLVLQRLDGHDFFIEHLQLDADVQYNGNNKESMALARGKLRLNGVGYAHYNQLPQDMELDFDLDFSHDNVLNIKELNLASQGLEALAQGAMDLNEMCFSAEINSHISAFQRFLPDEAMDLEITGDIGFQAAAEGNLQQNLYELEIDLWGQGLGFGEELLADLIGQEPRLSARASVSEDFSLDLKQAELFTREARLSTFGTVSLEQEELSLAAELDLENLEFLSKALEQEIRGKFSARASAEGPWDAVAVSLDVDISGLKPGPEIEVMDIQASVDSVYTPEAFPGSIRASLKSAPGRLDLSSDFLLQDDHLEVSNLLISGLDASIQGNLDLDLDSMLAHGDLDVYVPELESFAELTGQKLYGHISGRINLQRVQDRQDLSLNFEAMEVMLNGTSLIYMDLAAEGQDLYSSREFRADLNMSGLQAGPVYLSSWSTSLQGQDMEIGLSTSLDGQAVHPLVLSAQLSYTPGDNVHEINLETLQGKYAYENFSLQRALSAVIEDQEIRLSPSELSWGDGSLFFQGALTPVEVSLEVELQNLLLAQIPAPALDMFHGKLAGKLQVQGEPGKPGVSARLELSDFRSTVQDMPELDIVSTALLADNTVQVEASLFKGQDQLLGLEVELPAELSLEPAAFALPDPLPLQGRLFSTLELEKVAPLFLSPDQNLSGLIKSSMDISGTAQEPVFDGKMELEGGIFEDMNAGIYLREIKALIKARNDLMVLEELAASDGGTGRIEGAGRLSLDPDKNYQWDFHLQIQDADILRHSLAVVNIASCDLGLSGDASQALVQGSLTFGRIEAMLPKASPPGVVHLEVTEKNKPPDDLPPPPRKVDLEAYPVKLDLELSFPARVYVRGRGLDSEWGGRLYIEGMAHEPSIRGELSPVRGRLDFLDRRFDLDRESHVFLDGAFPPDPILDMRARYTQKDRDIFVRIHGRALSPELDLESDPPMHKDEILAWILFGRDLSDITPFQALTLLNAAHAMAVGEPGPGMMDQLRSLVGVDDIEITRDDEGEVQFGLGKYVHERVYMQVRKGAAPGSEEVAVEIDLTPRMSLEGSVESDADSGVFLFWKRDY